MAAAPMASARADLACPARACVIQASAIGPGGIARTNPTTSPTSRAVTIAHLLSARPGPRPLDGLGDPALPASIRRDVPRVVRKNGQYYFDNVTCIASDNP